jgi:hypothetical protein
MINRQFLIFLFLLVLSGTTGAESPWGPACTTLDECIELIRKPSLCNDGDMACRDEELEQPLQGKLQQGVERFGEAAVSPLLGILGTGSELEVARAAVLLVSNRHLKTEHGAAILAAWRRTPGSSINLLASNYATPAFAVEIMERLRTDPADSNAAHVFSNFREFEDKPPNGLTAAITEHIECGKGERCNSAFAKLQYDWISSNVESNHTSAKMAEVLLNTQLDEAGRLAALDFFRPSEFFRPKEQMRDLAIPTLRQHLTSDFPSIQLQAAIFLAGYGDASGADRLLHIAENEKSNKRSDALIALVGVAGEMRDKSDRILRLLTSRNLDVRRHALILLSEMGHDAIVDNLIAQIDAKDWLTTYSAISALRQFSSDQVQKVLIEVENTYWHPAVRDAARHQLSAKSNLAQLPSQEVAATKFADAAVGQFSSPIHEKQDYEVLNWCKSRFEKDGYQFVPDFITGPEVIEQGKKASRHNQEHFRKMLFQRDDMKSAVQPGLELSIDEWTFKGTAIDPNRSAEYGALQGQLVAERRGSPPQVILEQNIAGVFVWKGEPHVLTAGLIFRSHATLFKLTMNEQGVWSVDPVLRLTGTSQDWTYDQIDQNPKWEVYSKVWINKDQTIGILGGDGAVIVQSNGVPLWLGCGIPGFP